MPEKIKWNCVAQVLNGPSVSSVVEIEPDAYDKFEVLIIDSTTQAVDLVPSGKVFLLIVNPKKPDKKLTYDLGGSPIALDGPLTLIGEGAVSLLGGATSLTFTNGTGADVIIEILIGRDATP